jgi:hypothetical protein
VDKVRLFLVLLTIGIVVGPIVGVVYIYRDNLSGLVITPELRRLLVGYSENYILPGLTDAPIEPPQYNGSQYDPVSRTLNFSFSFTNPFDVGLMLQSMSSNVSCTLHGFHLGEATLVSPVSLGPNETVLIPLSVTLTQDAANHLATEHAEADTISVDLTDIRLNVGGIILDLDRTITIPDVPLGV